VSLMRFHGMDKNAWKRFDRSGSARYDITAAGFKYNMMDIQAALGLHQLERVEANWQRRRAIWARYQDAFAHLAVGRPTEPEPDTRHAHHLYTLMIDEATAGITRDAFLEAMTFHGIGTGVHYRALSEHPYYRERFGWRPDDHPHARDLGRRTVSLPLSPGLTDADVADVIEAVRRALPR
jgi:dTDP-4-amino-4,6-dideoxygalactose transaminase